MLSLQIVSVVCIIVCLGSIVLSYLAKAVNSRLQQGYRVTAAVSGLATGGLALIPAFEGALVVMHIGLFILFTWIGITYLRLALKARTGGAA